MNVRYRIDGVMWDSTTIPRRMVAGAVSRIKIMADLDIAEKRKPQDGRVSISLDGRVVDVRLVTLPTVEGESVVMRILEKDERVLSFEDLGMVGEPLTPLRAVDRALARRGARHRPDGLGQVDDALLGARHDPQPREDDHHDRGPGRGPRARASSRSRSTPRPASTSRRAALDDACRPRRDHGRRDPRPGDGDDRDRVVAHGSPDPLDAAHERRRRARSPGWSRWASSPSWSPRRSRVWSFFRLRDIQTGAVVDHPPLGVALLTVSTKFFEMSGGDLNGDTPGFRTAIKLPLFIFDLLLIAAGYVMAYRMAAHRTPQAGKVNALRPIFWASVVAAGLAFTPAVIADSVWWGQTDGVFSFFMLLTVYALHRRKTGLAAAFYALTILVKFQGIALLPIIVVLTFRRFGLIGIIRGVVVFAIVFAVGIGPFVMASGEDAWRPYRESVGKVPVYLDQRT